VVPENIHSFPPPPPPRKGLEIPKGWGGGSKAQEIPGRGGGGVRE